MNAGPTYTLGDKLEFLTSGSRGWAKYYSDSGAKFLRIQNVGRARLLLDDLAHVDPPESAEAKRTLVRPGDVLLSITADLGRTAVVPEGIGAAHINQHLAILRLNSDLHPPFVAAFIALGPGRRQIQRLDKVGVKSGLNFDDVRSIKVPALPIAEQRRIADILDKADTIRRKRQEAIALTESLLRSTFLEMFGDPVTNPKGWPVMRLDDCIAGVDAGWSAKGEDKPAATNEHGVLKISAVTSGRFRPDENKAVAEVPANKKLVVPKRGELLFSRANTRELVAATCLVEADVQHLFLPDKLWRLRARADRACVEYLRYLLSNERFRASLTKKATGTSGSMLNVSKAKLMEMVAPVPPMTLQNAFKKIVWQSFGLRHRHEDVAAKARALFDSLVQRAFRGEL